MIAREFPAYSNACSGRIGAQQKTAPAGNGGLTHRIGTSDWRAAMQSIENPASTLQMEVTR